MVDYGCFSPLRMLRQKYHRFSGLETTNISYSSGGWEVQDPRYLVDPVGKRREKKRREERERSGERQQEIERQREHLSCVS